MRSEFHRPLLTPDPEEDEHLRVAAVFVAPAPRRAADDEDVAPPCSETSTVFNLAASTAFHEGLGLVGMRKTKGFVPFSAISLVDVHTAIEFSGRVVSEDKPNRRKRVEIHVSNIAVAHRRLAESVRQVQVILESSWGEPSFTC